MLKVIQISETDIKIIAKQAMVIRFPVQVMVFGDVIQPYLGVEVLTGGVAIANEMPCIGKDQNEIGYYHLEAGDGKRIYQPSGA